ncbi:MAG: trehalose-phosphatase [Myxococcota bacterium]
MVGLHGAEWPGEPSPTKSAAAAAALQQLHGLCSAFPKLLVEDKGAGVAAHWGQVSPDQHGQAAAAVEKILRPWIQRTHGQRNAMSLLAGHHMLELRLASASKACAAQRLIKQNPQLHPVFIGDDLSDEEALAYLSSLDIPTTTIRVAATTVKTDAAYRLAGPEQVHAFLATLAKLTGGHGVA